METITISGMSREHFVKAVTRALMNVNGIENLTVLL